MVLDESLYRRQPGFVLGFHGCDQAVGEAVLRGEVRHLAASRNQYDWLGSGIYFWENDPQRALEFAREAMHRPVSRGSVRTPFVIGAVIDPGLCLNLLQRECIDEVIKAYEYLRASYETAGKALPHNGGPGRGLRHLDRAVLETLHTTRQMVNARPGRLQGRQPAYESVRGAFLEGDEVYPGAGFRQKNHIQLAIRNPGCIKGYFRPLGVTD